MAKLIKRTVEALSTKRSDYFVWDDDLKGFGVRVHPSGRKTFIAQYRMGGRQRRVKLGVFGAVTTDEARTLAQRVMGDVAKGQNPAEQIGTYRRAPTLADLCERLMAEHAAQRLKPTTRREYRRSVDKFIKPALGPRKIGDITRADVAALHHQMRHIPYQANRTLGVLSKLFNLCEVWGLRPDGSNPCRHVPKNRENKRERFLSPAEIATLSRTLDEVERDGSETASAVNAFRLLILTGCRLSEIQKLKWAYVEYGYLHLPDSKTGARKIPIDERVRGVLTGITQLDGNPYVITGKKPGEHLTDLQRPWRRIRARAGLDGVRIHDLRHTYASLAIASGLNLEMVGKLLGHTQLQTTARYAHLSDGLVRDAASQVSASIGSFLERGRQPRKVAAGSGNVVAFPRNERAL